MSWFLLLIFCGFLVGAVSSATGIGGGLILVFFLLFQIDDGSLGAYDLPRAVIANGVVVLLAVNLSMLLSRLRDVRPYQRAVVESSLPAIAVSVTLTYLLIHHDWLTITFYRSLLVLLTFYSMVVLIRHREASMLDTCRRAGKVQSLRNGLAGTLAGLLAALTGTESGTVLVPTLNRICGLQIRQAVNVFIIVLFLVMLSMIAVFASSPDGVGYWRPDLMLPLAVGGFLGSFLGYSLFRRYPVQWLSYPILVFLVAISFRLLFFDILYPLY